MSINTLNFIHSNLSKSESAKNISALKSLLPNINITNKILYPYNSFHTMKYNKNRSKSRSRKSSISQSIPFQNDQTYLPMISICDILPEEMILYVLCYLSPSEQSKIATTNHLIYELTQEAAKHLFYDTFGSMTPTKLKHGQIIGILQNVYLARDNREKAKKILCWASSKGYIKFIKDIANKSVLPCLNGILNLRASQFSHGMTPLYLAVRQQHVDIVEFLIASSPNVRINELCSSYSHTISHIAASKGYLNILQIIGKYSTINKENIRDSTITVNLKWDINKKDGINLYSPLMTAIIHGSYSSASYLIEYGADVNFKDKNEMTLLYHAAENGHVGICDLLLKHGADINAQSKAGKSSLFISCDQGWLDVAILLVNNGANVRLKSSRGKLPLYVAAEKGYKDIVKLLLKHSRVSDLFTMTSYGTTPFFIASKQLDKGVKSLFKRFCVKQQTLKKGGNKKATQINRTSYIYNNNNKRKYKGNKNVNIMSEHEEILRLSNSDIISEESIGSSSQSSVKKAIEDSQKWLEEKQRENDSTNNNRTHSAGYNRKIRKGGKGGPIAIYHDSVYPIRQYETKQTKPFASITAAHMFRRTNSDNSINIDAAKSITSTQEFYAERLPTPLFAHEMEDFHDAHSEQIHYRKKKKHLQNLYNFSSYNGGIISVAGKKKTLKNPHRLMTHRYYQSVVKPKNNKKKRLWR